MLRQLTVLDTLYTTGGPKGQVANGGCVGRLFPAEAFIFKMNPGLATLNQD